MTLIKPFHLTPFEENFQQKANVNWDAIIEYINARDSFASVPRNFIINGDMRIDQRNAGASVVWGSGSLLPVDRWRCFAQSGSGHTAQQSTTVPSSFRYSTKLTVGTGAAPSAAHENLFYTSIEGFDFANAGFGTSWANSVTLSFFVRSSIAGTYGVAFQNNALNRCRVATYTISSADTWEYKTITIPGDTSGTWDTTNGVGIRILFDLGDGSNYEGTADTWGSSLIRRTSACVKLIATSAATFYLTGVQLEISSLATPFEFLNFEQSREMCRRYFRTSFPYGTAVAQNSGVTAGSLKYRSQYAGVSGWHFYVPLDPPMRIAPTCVAYNPQAANSNWRDIGIADSGASTFVDVGTNGFSIFNPQVAGDVKDHNIGIHYSADSEL